MMSLRDFLAARLAEDEAVARAAADFGADWRFADDIFPSDDSRHPGSIIAGSYGCGIPDQYGNHVVRHDPARVLRDVEAVRRVLRMYDNAVAAVAAGSLSARNRAQDETAVEMLGEVLRALAAAHADHPDYREDWRP